MRERFINKNFRQESLEMIVLVNYIIKEYTEQGLSLTLRQLYYQFVARGYLENTLRAYGKLGNIVNQGRLAGLIDWEAIEDRTRNLSVTPTWTNPSSILDSAAYSYKIDLWEYQPYYIEGWIEKEALAGVLQKACREYRVSFFSCRGYVSQSEMWRAAKRIQGKVEGGKKVLIIHLGDHDPSGIDMTRDIIDRVKLLNYDDLYNIEVHRIALNMDQVEEHSPPPNPAKLSDTRAYKYIRRFGKSSWELDALDPKTLVKLIQERITKEIDWTSWEYYAKKEEEEKQKIKDISDKFRSGEI